ncbi:MAG: AgmX/PglI C-terminal domain-containing protein [Myxococcales bacterium]|jgi:hypothetical protein
MKATSRILAILLALAPASAFAQATEAKGGDEATKAVPTSLDGVAPGTPEQPGLDVSRMPFDPESIRQVVKFHMPEIQRCYEKVLSDSGKRLEGRVMVGFTIDLNGNVTELKALPKKSTVKDDRVVDCVLLAARRFVFPKPPDNRIYPIEYPFDLKVTR